MTDKEERFCQEYLIDLNATQSAIRAGYSQKTAGEIGYENLKKPHIVDKITELKQARAKRTEITADRVLRELAKLGFSNIQDYIEEDMSFANIKQLSRKKTAAISSIKKSKTTFGNGESKGEKETIEFRLYDKKGALELIGKHIGFFEKDNEQKAEAGHTFNFDFGDDEGEQQEGND